MPIPVVSLPKQGPIATRPRREAYYDTEGWNSGAAIAAKITLFQSATAFGNSSLGLTKKKGRDHNMDNGGGLMPQGQAVHVYAVTNKIRPLGTVLNAAPFPGEWDLIRRIRESTWFTWLFSNVPYISYPLVRVPDGVGVMKCYTTVNAITAVSPAQSALSRAEALDVTLNRQPVVLTQLESFAVTIESQSPQPSPDVDLYDTWSFKGIHLKGIQG